MNNTIIIIIPAFCLFNCKTECKPKVKSVINKTQSQTPVKIFILPLGKVNESIISGTYRDIKKIFQNIEVMAPEGMPSNAFYPPRNRYRADTLIRWMSKRANSNEIFVGITMNDISATKNTIPDYGIMGLGYCPGNACVVSGFRLKDKSNFFKVVVHEMGHTTGLLHCPDKACYMKDAEGVDTTDDEKGFCTKCSGYLRKKGWKI